MSEEEEIEVCQVCGSENNLNYVPNGFFFSTSIICDNCASEYSHEFKLRKVEERPERIKSDPSGEIPVHKKERGRKFSKSLWERFSKDDQGAWKHCFRCFDSIPRSVKSYNCERCYHELRPRKINFRMPRYGCTFLYLEEPNVDYTMTSGGKRTDFCHVCSKQFTTHSFFRKYCSRECEAVSRTIPRKLCVVCARANTTRPDSSCCSLKCARILTGKKRKTSVKVKCEHCEKDFEVVPAVFKRGNVKYCSRECRWAEYYGKIRPKKPEVQVPIVSVPQLPTEEELIENAWERRLDPWKKDIAGIMQ